MKVRIRARARHDVDAILEHSVVAHGVARAEAYLRAIDAALTRLTDYPELGVASSDLAPEMRSLPIGEHRIFYLLLPDRISVARVLHKAMDVERHLQQRDPFRGWGKPGPLSGNLSGWWSRRINREHRLVYRVTGKGEAQALEVAGCWYWY